MFDVRVLSPGAWATAVAVEWSERLLDDRGLVHCLPSGMTTIPVYGEMVRRHRARKVSFAGSTIALVDEFGGLAADDEGRCRAMLQRDLLSHVDLRHEDLISLDAESDDIEVECARVASLISARGGLGLTLLGIGTNGHVGLNEPGSSANSSVRRVELAESTTQAAGRYISGLKLPTWGVTLGMRELLASQEVWLLATGKHKASIVAELMKAKKTEDIPATMFFDHPKVVVWLDADAASGRQ